MKWEEIITIEPMIERLYLTALIEDCESDNEALDIFFNTYKPQIENLAGHFAQKDALATSEVYDIVYRKILDSLGA